MILYCKTCNFRNVLEYDSNGHNLFGQSCGESLIGRTGDIELYVTKDSFIHFMRNGFTKSLMKLYKRKILISRDD